MISNTVSSNILNLLAYLVLNMSRLFEQARIYADSHSNPNSIDDG